MRASGSSRYANAHTFRGFLRIFRLAATVHCSIRFRFRPGNAPQIPPRAGYGNDDDINLAGAWIMGKYFLGWILGVPVFLLVILYLIFN